MSISKEKIEGFANCPVRDILDRFGDKWSLLILLTLSGAGSRRFGELSKELPDISQKMLTVTLRALEADGLVSRRLYAEIPPRTEYKLTDLGESLIPFINGLLGWAKQNTDTILKTRQIYQEKTTAIAA
ncbi:MAG: helix-turn-helix domain-containing protein [Bacteroidota bacterium]